MLGVYKRGEGGEGEAGRGEESERDGTFVISPS